MNIISINDVPDMAEFYRMLIDQHSPRINDFAFTLILSELCRLNYRDTCVFLGIDK